MIRMLIVGYCFGIRSERRLCERSASQPGLSLVLAGGDRGCGAGALDVFEESARPAFVQAMHPTRFETVLQRCMNEGLVGGEGFAIDASVIKPMRPRGRHPGAAIDHRALGPAQASRACE